MLALSSSLTNASSVLHSRPSRSSPRMRAVAVVRPAARLQGKPAVHAAKAGQHLLAFRPQQARGFKIPQGHRRQPHRQSLMCTAAAICAPALATACLLPTCLGFYVSEMAVSYGYGTATALSAYLIHEAAVKAGSWEWAVAHSLALIIYGLRLNVYLFWRQTVIPRFKERYQEAKTSAGNRLGRTPFIVSCALLYLGLAAPLVLSAQAWTGVTAATGALASAFKVCVSAAFVGLVVAAVGDLQKSMAKSAGQGLVTGGLYSVLRHPNYTGEMLLWTSSWVAGCLAFAALPTRSVGHMGWLALSTLGCIGINFVLMMATRGLEKRQREQYGSGSSGSKWSGSKYNSGKYSGDKYSGNKYGDDSYDKWVDSTWGGFSL
eukprot:CAMPEP_0118923888 /NCGR_PEP_ID=MMETSP1169-20130426/2252_1 /TAXON_ID=36882 /ORGANISM="Pyramimonas obovata, Strain CCMP722" /LENGTH=375 /DNA_ID=CAMNT_0006864943 /DNA_START=50 /DNA_END=1177 /DNA_ORIENTATION=-